MLFSSWLRNGKRSAPPARRRTSTSPRQRASFRPRLEALEERLTPSSSYVQTNLAGNQPDSARFTDNNLNGWGMTSLPNGTFVVANTFTTGLATFYRHSGNPLPLTIKVPVEAAESQFLHDNVSSNISTVYGHPTGVVYNPTNDFVISENGKSAPATLIFDTLDGTICGWNPAVDPTNAIVIRDTWAAGSPAVYTALEIGQNSSGQNVLYAADFLNNKLEVINGSFTTIRTTNCAGLGVSTDPHSSVWSVSAVNDKLIVTFADLLGPVIGGGAVDVFDTDGNFVQQIDQNGPTSNVAANATGRLENPWGVTLAPANFGTYSNDLLVGNVWGPGHINAYQADSTGNYTIYAGQLAKPDGTPIAIKGLWDMEFDDGPHLFFDAGPNKPGDSTGGLLGVIHRAGEGPRVQGCASIAVGNHAVGVPSSPPNLCSGQDQGMQALSLMSQTLAMVPASNLQAMDQQIDAYYRTLNAMLAAQGSRLERMDAQLSTFIPMLKADLDALETTSV